jgi:hypothetical protein
MKLVVAFALLVGACVIASPPTPCAGWSPIRPELGETIKLSPELRAQILAHNKFGQSTCHWEP